MKSRIGLWLSSLPDGHLHSSSRWRAVLRYGAIAFIISITLSSILLFTGPEASLINTSKDLIQTFWHNRINTTAAATAETEAETATTITTHPIEQLISDARTHHKSLLEQQSFNLSSAAQRYRQRRQRHPPPGFDAWFNYAIEHDAIIVESFFDRIYADLTPYWALDPQDIAEKASSWHHVVRVRNGVANGTGNVEGLVPWLQLWTGLVAEAAPHLPDVDMPINYMDESRLMVPWEKIREYVEVERGYRTEIPLDHVMKNYTGLAKVAAKGKLQPHDPDWITSENYWDLTRVACAPNSPSRNVPSPEDIEALPRFTDDWSPEYQYDGYVRNFTAALDPCIQPHLRGTHGTFIEPLTLSTSQELIPLFGGSKLPTNNEILIPGAMYLTDDPFYSGGDSHGPPWGHKKTGVVWRGVASGGRNRKENWMHFQRHRLVEMLNGTTVAGLERNASARAPAFEMPPLAKYDFPRRREGTVGQWLQELANVGFVDLLCFPADSNCSYVAPWFHVVDSVPMAEQYQYKFMPDVDGNSFSARFRGLLSSTSLPLKATVYAEWHDDRLVPWLHFAPLDNTLQDLYGVLDFFTRDRDGDNAARFIAEEGTAWGARVLRREDMLLYVWRLLLEFARVCDENRVWLGYIDDLL